MERSEQPLYKVVVNAEEQYSVWPLHKDNAPGWRDAGVTGTHDECLAQVGQLWRDMRPMSLRDHG